MPQMVALYNGMGGGSAAAIGAVELLAQRCRRRADRASTADPSVLAVRRRADRRGLASRAR